MTPIQDQAFRLRQMVQQGRRARRARTIAVTSGKGGVGKSNIALNLSILLSADGRRVTLVDADWGLGNLDVLLGLDARADLSHVVDGTRRLEEVVVALPSGVRFVPGAGGPAAPADLNEFQRAALRKEMQTLEEDSDFVVLDTGAGIGSGVLHVAAGADTALVVTTPEPTAIAGAYALIKTLCLQSYTGRIRLLVNCAADRGEADLTHRTLSRAARQFLAAEVACAGYVLDDPKVREAVRSRRPFVLAFPLCPATTCLAATAAQLCREGLEAQGQDRLLHEAADGSA